MYLSSLLCSSVFMSISSYYCISFWFTSYTISKKLICNELTLEYKSWATLEDSFLKLLVAQRRKLRSKFRKNKHQTLKCNVHDVNFEILTSKLGITASTKRIFQMAISQKRTKNVCFSHSTKDIFHLMFYLLYSCLWVHS